MANHSMAADDRFTDREPATASEVVRMILALLIGAGWLTLDTHVVTWIATVVGALISIAMTWWTRRNVTPVVNPKDKDGVPLKRPVP